MPANNVPKESSVVPPLKALPPGVGVGKPPYRVPSMDEIRAMPPNGFTVASTFSGTGGSSLGYRMAGFRVLYANEFVEAARDSYRANMAPYTVLDDRDIRAVTPESVLDLIGLRPGELDLLDGSPPCASFSTAGKREKGWGETKKYSDTEQRSDDLFFEYARLLRGIQPKTFVAENVSGLVKGKAKGYFLEILRELKACGYRVSARLLDAQWLGVPQARQRLIFVGVRDDLGVEPVHPEPLGYRYSIRDALPWLVEPKLVIGGDARPNKPGNSFPLVRPDASEPSPTITASGGGGGSAGVPGSVAAVAHPTEKRKFSIAELRRICSFPDDFVLTGTYAQQWERLGRSVPPVMMKAIAERIRDEVLAKCP